VVNIAAYAKFIVAVVGAGITAALTFAAPGTPVFEWLTIGSAVLTAIGVYFVPNAPLSDSTPGRHEATGDTAQ
jgi:hypothetical protein